MSHPKTSTGKKEHEPTNRNFRIVIKGDKDDHESFIMYLNSLQQLEYGQRVHQNRFNFWKVKQIYDKDGHRMEGYFQSYTPCSARKVKARFMDFVNAVRVPSEDFIITMIKFQAVGDEDVWLKDSVNPELEQEWGNRSQLGRRPKEGTVLRHIRDQEKRRIMRENNVKDHIKDKDSTINCKCPEYAVVCKCPVPEMWPVPDHLLCEHKKKQEQEVPILERPTSTMHCTCCNLLPGECMSHFNESY